jgi:serine protease Do
MTRWLMIALLAYSAPVTGQNGVSGLAQINQSFEALADQVGPSIVQILVSGYSPSSGIVRSTGDLLAQQRSTGSGVILDSDGYIVTNAHVVEGSQRVQVVLPPSGPGQGGRGSILSTGGRLVGAQIVNIDRETDLAVIKVHAENLPALELADSDQLRQGQLVFAFGSPLGLNNSVTMGSSAPSQDNSNQKVP